MAYPHSIILRMIVTTGLIQLFVFFFLVSPVFSVVRVLLRLVFISGTQGGVGERKCGAQEDEMTRSIVRITEFRVETTI